MSDERPQIATDAVLVHSEDWDGPDVDGIDFDKPENRAITAKSMVRQMRYMGFQASAVSQAAEIIDDMRKWEGVDEDGKPIKTTVFLGYTSNLISSGMRSTLKYLVKHKHVSAIVTTGGGIEEDLIKCLAPTKMGDFTLKGDKLRSKGLNRIGNLIVPNDNYTKFEDWVVPILAQMYEEQAADPENVNWTPSKVIDRLGKEINDEDSVLYWAHKNQIPVFCPALTDGSLGDMLFFYSFKNQLKVDLVEDIRKINMMSINAKRAGMVILGGGLVKHHIANACLMRNGADYAVYINTAQEFDGSDAGARPDEAVSWGKIKAEARSVKVYCEVTAVFPMIVAATWASEPEENTN